MIIYLNFFGRNFWTRSARWPIKGSKDVIAEFQKNLSQKIGSQVSVTLAKNV